MLGSAVNPVLREGNSDRRCAKPVKEMAMKQVKRSPAMKPYNKDNKSYVSHMADGDFYGSEQSHIMKSAGTVSIVFKGTDGSEKVLKDNLKLEAGEIIDASRMSKRALTKFFEDEIADCMEKGLMISLHLKATMMKVSDPIMFGHMVKVFYKDVFTKHGDLFKELGVNVNNGLGDIYDKIRGHSKQVEVDTENRNTLKALFTIFKVETDIQHCYNSRPRVAMVDSSKGKSVLV